MTVNITFLDTKTIGEIPNLNCLDKFGNYKKYNLTKPDEISDRIKGQEVIITNKVVINADIMDASPDLKLICIAATGMNNVDLDHAKKKGIVVKNVSGYSTESVAQSTFALLLHLVNKIAYYDNYVKSGKYIESDIFCHLDEPFFELSGKIMGVVGMGNIGKRVSDIATGFGMKVIYFSTSGKNKVDKYRQVDLQTLMKNADVVSVHCPLNEKTNNLIALKELEQMKSQGIILNMARGGIVNEQDLAVVLNQEKIGGAGIDVFTKEPISTDNPLLRVKKNIVLMPHVAWGTVESRIRLMDLIYKNIEDFIEKSSGK